MSNLFERCSIDAWTRMVGRDKCRSCRCIAGAPGFVCFLFEHQSSTDAGMPLRLLGYIARSWERSWREHPGKPLAPIVPVVISHDPKGWNSPRELAGLLPEGLRRHEVLHDVTPNFRYFVDDLSELSDADLRARALAPVPTLVLWALRDARSPERLLRSLDALADVLTDVLNAVDGRDAIQQIFMYISTVADNLVYEKFKARVAQLSPAAEESIMTIAEQLRAEGLQQGLQQGLELQRATLAKLLTIKFGPPSSQVTARVHAADIDTIGRWIERILTTDTAEAVVEL